MISHSKPWILPQDLDALRAVAASGWLVGGPTRARTRGALADVVGGASAALFPSGRAALSSALRALDIPPGAGIMVQTYACDAVRWAIKAAGFDVVLCDIDAGWTCSPATIAAAMTPSVRALILAPPFGLFQSAAPFRKFGLPIVHDLCQANPAGLKGRWDEAGDLAALSFHPTKYLGRGGRRGAGRRGGACGGFGRVGGRVGCVRAVRRSGGGGDPRTDRANPGDQGPA